MCLQLKEGQACGGSGWLAAHTVNKRAQSGLALIHILAALGYDWGLQVLLPLGAKLNLQVGSSCTGAVPASLCWAYGLMQGLRNLTTDAEASMQQPPR